MVHAGVVPQWTAALTMAARAAKSSRRCGAIHAALLAAMYGDEPDHWQPSSVASIGCGSPSTC